MSNPNNTFSNDLSDEEPPYDYDDESGESSRQHLLQMYGPRDDNESLENIFPVVPLTGNIPATTVNPNLDGLDEQQLRHAMEEDSATRMRREQDQEQSYEELRNRLIQFRQPGGKRRKYRKSRKSRKVRTGRKTRKSRKSRKVRRGRKSRKARRSRK